MINITIPGKPQGKARARTVKNKYTDKTHSYTPENTANYEAFIKTLAMQEMRGKEIITGPVEMFVTIFHRIPKNTSKANIEKMLNGEIRPCKKPDIDNIIKSIADSLNGIVYTDDNQICYMNATKHYSCTPRVNIGVYEISAIRG